jgi:hypothetical protein
MPRGLRHVALSISLLVTDGEMTGGFISDAEPVIGRRYAPTRWRIPE